MFDSLFLAELNIGLFVMQMLLLLTSIFLMLLILVQRGKGGGLTGALGGSGGSSAFGAKAGDAFTRITIVVALFWIGFCMVTIYFFNSPPSPNQQLDNSGALTSPEDSDDEAGALDGGTGAVDLGTSPPPTGGISATPEEPAKPAGEGSEDGN